MQFTASTGSMGSGGGSASASASALASSTTRTSTLAIPHSRSTGRLPSDPDVRAHCEIVYDEEADAITDERLALAYEQHHLSESTEPGSLRGEGGRIERDSTFLSDAEARRLMGEQKTIRRSLFLKTNNDVNALLEGGALDVEGMKNGGGGGGGRFSDITEVSEEGEDYDDDDDDDKGEETNQVSELKLPPSPPQDQDQAAAFVDTFPFHKPIEPPDPLPGNWHKSKPAANPRGGKNGSSRLSVGTVRAQLVHAKLRARNHHGNDGVLGMQSSNKRNMRRQNSLFGHHSGVVKPRGVGKFLMYNLEMSARSSSVGGDDFFIEDEEEDEAGEDRREEEKKEMDVEDISYVRKPNLARIIEQYEAMRNHPKYTLRQVVLSRRFHLYAHRFGNAQYQRTLVYPTLPQPAEMFDTPGACPWLCYECNEEDAEPVTKPVAKVVTEKTRTRHSGHRFVIAADSQFGILMDGFAMDVPNWSQEIEISRRCVEQINAMTGDQRPLFVCVCGDLVDTESSFSGAIASWKKVMSGWERNLVFEQQVKDFKRVWSNLHHDIALVCLCGNHDVGNRPTRASIEHWTSSFGDDFLCFWANGTFNLCLNNCLFSNPSGAPDLFDEQLAWMESKLKYARENDATHIFVYGHFPWFLKHEEEADDYLTSYSKAPQGWGPPGSRFADGYFTVPYAQRKLAMDMFRKYDVSACFSGHFHQNVVAKTSWGMPMIVTGPLSMNLNSEIAHELAQGETNGIGMRVVDVGQERGSFTHEWMLLEEEDELYEHAVERCIRQSTLGTEVKNELRRSLFKNPEGSRKSLKKSARQSLIDLGQTLMLDEDEFDIDAVHLGEEEFNALHSHLDSSVDLSSLDLQELGR